MTINESLGSPLYFAYKNAGPTPGLILPALILNIVAFSGVIMNSFVVFITIVTKSLHGTANFLLALVCFCEVAHQSGHSIFLYIAVSGTNFVDTYTAVLLMLPMLFGANSSLAGMALAAFDRLFAVISPKWHKRIGQKGYMALLTIVCASYGVYGAVFTLHFAKENPDIPQSGNVADLLVGDPGQKFFYYSVSLNGISIFCYALVGIIIRKKTGVTKETNTRLMKSLAIIIAINIGGYLVSLCFYQLLFTMSKYMDFITIWQLGTIPGLSLNIGAACNAPVLYMTSSEYRKAICRNLHKIAHLCGMKRMAHNNSHHQQAEGDRMFNVRYTTAAGAPAAATKMASMRQLGGGTRIVPNTTLSSVTIQQVGGLSTSLP